MLYFIAWLLCGVIATVIGAAAGSGWLSIVIWLFLGPIGIAAALFHTGYPKRAWVVPGIIILVVWASWFLIAPRLTSASGDASNPYAPAGAMGDMFGALNTLFTGLALAGVVYSIQQQREQLRVANDELKLAHEERVQSREELKLAHEERAESKRAAELSQFEGTLFQLLAMLNNVTDSISFSGYRGREGLNSLVANAVEQLTRVKEIKDASSLADRWREIAVNYEFRFPSKYSPHVSHYFRILYRIMEHIDDAPADAAGKLRYAKMFRAQLSDFEIALLFLNGFAEHGKPMTKHLETYALLKHMPRNTVLSEADRSYYKPSAYRDSDE